MEQKLGFGLRSIRTQAAKIKFLHSIENVIKRDRIRNEVTIERAGVQSIEEF
jgi:hypothetical protein